MILSLDEAMQLAMDEALKGAPFVSPNPKVGCVILDPQGRLLSKGYHPEYGQAHAEIEALKDLSPEQLRDAHVIVTLEPCAHEGKTPSCAKRLATLPIKKVTYGLIDPNPLVAGQGAAILQQAGIQTAEYQGLLKMRLEEICEEFLWNFRQRKVFVALKVAQSLDGKIALKSGESRWITGPESRTRVHELRAQYDAVLVGKKTVLNDDPSLNVRHSRIVKENKVVILDRKGDVLRQAEQLALFRMHRPENIFLCVGDQGPTASTKARVLQVDTLEGTLAALYEAGLRSLLVEGGGQVFSSFLKQGLVQRLHVFTAPVILGQGVSWTEGLEISSMKDRMALEKGKTQKFGSDLYWTGTLART